MCANLGAAPGVTALSPNGHCPLEALMVQLGRARAAWKDQALGEFIRLRCNVLASRDVAGRLLRAAGQLQDVACGLGEPAEALRDPLDDLIRLALYARAGRDVMPELIGATLVFVFDALEQAEVGAAPERLRWLRTTGEAFVAAIAHGARHHAAVSFEDYRAAKAKAEALAGTGVSTIRVEPPPVAAWSPANPARHEPRYGWCSADVARDARAS